MNKISIMTPCYNEVDNVQAVYEQVKAIFESLAQYEYEHIFIDNDSQDGTQDKLRSIAAQDTKVKCIFNARNFGHICSPHHAFLQTTGDAVISLVADLQDPPEVIKTFLEKWESGYKIVVGVKPSSDEKGVMPLLRKFYYRIIDKISSVPMIQNFTGFGLYDHAVVEALKAMPDAYPYFRGMICELGYPICQVEYHQPLRQRGKTKNNIATNFDMAILGVTAYSKTPIRLATLLGLLLSGFGLLLMILYYLIGVPFLGFSVMSSGFVLLAVIFFAGVQLGFMGMLGEYILSIRTKVTKRPLVIEKERINWE